MLDVISYSKIKKGGGGSGSGGDTNLKQSLTVNNSLGSATAGKTYAANTPLETVLRDVLIKYIAPTVNFTISPTTTLYEIGKTASNITMTAAVTKQSNIINSIKYYAGSTLLDTKTESTNAGLSNGGNYSYKYTGSITTDTTLKVVVNDSKTDTSKTVSISFVPATYYGIDGNTLTKVLQKKGTITYNNITCTDSSVVLKYAKSWGALKSIKDSNNFENLDSFTQTEETINSIDYYVYTSGKATLSDFKYTFSF